MFSRKILLLVVLPIGLLIGGGALYLAITPSTEVVDPAMHWEPKLPSGPAFTLTPESTGVLWRKSTTNDQGKVTGLEIGYQDGRRGVYLLGTDEKVKQFTCFAADNSTLFKADYGTDGLIDRSETFRPDGTKQAEYRRGPDGSITTDTFGPDGRRVDLSVNTLPDGSQRTARRAADGTVSVETVKAESSEQNIGERLGNDGNVTPVFKLTMSGVRVTAWEYFDDGGILRHRGVFTTDGGMEVTLYNDNGKALLKQTWKRSGEDWNRTFYRVTDLELYSDQGTVEARVRMNADGMTPAEVAYFNSWDGRISRKDIFNSKGVIQRQEQYWGQPTPAFTREIPPEQQQQVVLPAQLVGEPAGMNPNKRVYRILGTPFADQLPAQPATLPPLFIAP
ncbi:MAG: hypothetical protein K2W95_26710 [Candidatus Obscuribacterales bacterium]|nr:hypothetical protein [Candidatus Obscuribacterales bacterium]